MSSKELRQRCKDKEQQPDENALDLARVWPLWNEACHADGCLRMRMSQERCTIVRVEGTAERVVVPSDKPGHAIRRAWLETCVS